MDLGARGGFSHRAEAHAVSEKQLELYSAFAACCSTESTHYDLKLTELQGELEAYDACDPIRVLKEKRRAVILARGAALRHTGSWRAYHLPLPLLYFFFFSPSTWCRRTKELTRDCGQLLDFDVPFDNIMSIRRTSVRILELDPTMKLYEESYREHKQAEIVIVLRGIQ